MSFVVSVASYLVVQIPVGDEKQVIINHYHVSRLDKSGKVGVSYTETAQQSSPHSHKSVIVGIHIKM